MKFFVTGGSGFIGRALCRALVGRGDEVIVLTRNARLHIPGVKILVGDVHEWCGELPAQLQDVDVIVNCMGEISSESKMYSLHVAGTRKVIDSFLNSSKENNRPIHIVQLSSVGAYGMVSRSNGHKIIVDEKDFPCPVGLYEVTKTVADEIIVSYCAAEPALSYTIVRPTNVVGHDMSNQSFRQLSQVVRRGLFFYIADKQSIANYIHVEDVVRALVLCALDERAKNKTYIVSNDCLLCEVVDAMADFHKVKAPALVVPEKLVRVFTALCSHIPKFPLKKSRVDALVSRVEYSSALIRRELGFNASFSIPSSISSILAHQQ
ncbi:Nucleoside-diphosphate-sugar epimerase [Pseudomonas sp. IT-P2]|jgi:nucleoside-diphosphate-sugar epimerase|uniref:NAD-dependent epimerase/dehydratase family protein n=1 Tax=Pseudomonas sp. IT-P2 TaxID=3026456 RepID=UPI0039E0F983